MARGMLRSEKTRDGLAAILAYNLGDMEEELYEHKQEIDQKMAMFDEIEAAMEQGGVRVLNRPNLLKQNWWTNGTGVDHDVIFGRASRISGESYPYLTSFRAPTETTQTTAPTAEQKAAATAIYSSTEEGVTTYHIFTDDDDFQATVAALASANQITEQDGENYAKAIQYAITANTAYGNMEWLLYCRSRASRTYSEGATVRNYGQIEEMIPGEKYSMSCWVRVISGDGVWMKMGYGGSYENAPYNVPGNSNMGTSDWIKVEPMGGVWQRISWSFDFNPVGDWYTETSEVVEGVTKITRTYNWFKKVGFGFGRKYDATIQVCGFRLVRGRTFISETYDDLEDQMFQTRIRMTALETDTAAALDGTMANMADSEETVAGQNHEIGDLFIVGGVLYRATAAIAAGETITVGTNVAITTIEAEMALKANVADPEFTGSISLGRKANTTVGARSFAVGAEVEASGIRAHAEGSYTVASGVASHAEGHNNQAIGAQSHAEGGGTLANQPAAHAEGLGTKALGMGSHAEGNNTIANGLYQHVFGAYNEQDMNQTYVEIVGNGDDNNHRSNARMLDWEGNESLAGGLTLGKGSADETELTPGRLQALLDRDNRIIYGFHIDGSENDPSEAVTYLADAVGAVPAYMDYTAGRFNYGSWKDAFFMPRPCMLKYDGTVDYYLDPKDYSKKKDGTASDVSNTSYAGNAMMEWGRNGKKIWYKIVPDTGDNTSASVYIADHQADGDFHAWSFINNQGDLVDHFYTPMYIGTLVNNGTNDVLRSLSGQNGSSRCKVKNVTTEIAAAKANNPTGVDIWNTEVYADAVLINLLLILMGKSLDTQTVFGEGIHTGITMNACDGFVSGQHDDKGMFYGTNSGDAADNANAVKVFGMENWYGYTTRRIAGLITVDRAVKYKMTSGTEDGSTAEGYNTNGNGYLTGGTIPTSSGSDLFVSKMEFDGNQFTPKAYGGSESTFYCDGLLSASGTMYGQRGGGNTSIKKKAGAFFLDMTSSVGTGAWTTGVAPSCKPQA